MRKFLLKCVLVFAAGSCLATPIDYFFTMQLHSVGPNDPMGLNNAVFEMNAHVDPDTSVNDFFVGYSRWYYTFGEMRLSGSNGFDGEWSFGGPGHLLLTNQSVGLLDWNFLYASDPTVIFFPGPIHFRLDHPFDVALNRNGRILPFAFEAQSFVSVGSSRIEFWNVPGENYEIVGGSAYARERGVPEPGSLSLLMVGGLLALAARRRRLQS